MKLFFTISIVLFSTLALNAQTEHGAVYSHLGEKYNLIGGGIAFAPSGFGNTLDDQFPDIKGSNNAFRIGGFYGFNLYSYERSAGFINLGLELTYKHFSFDGFYETHYPSADADLDTYIRNISADIIDESWNSFAITIPVTYCNRFNLTPRASNPFYLSAEAGVYAAFRAVQNCSFQVSARYTGTYPQYWNLEMDQYYDYGNFRFDEKEVEPDMRLHKLDVGAILGLGLWYEIKSQAFLRLDFSVRKGLVSEAQYLDKYVITGNAKNYVPVLNSSDSGLLDTYIGLSFIYNYSRTAARSSSSQ